MTEKPVSSQNSEMRNREALSYLSQISHLLNTGLDAEALTICVRLCEAGVHPEALACAVREVRREVGALKQSCNTEESSSRKFV